MKKFLVASLLAGAMLFNTASTTMAAPAQDRETIYQVALLQSLAMGYFDGSITVKELKTHGDTGIGTFEGLDGEMIVLDGVVYRANQNCKINVVADKVTIPFGNVTFFDADIKGDIVNCNGKEQIDKLLNEKIQAASSVNSFYMVKIHGEFSELLIRSEAKQFPPYPTLVESLKATQKEFTHKNIKGTIVGLYCPDFMSSLNSTGWHFHFISDDKKIGGHVLNANVKKATYQMDQTDGFRLNLPKKENFSELNFNRDMKEDIRKAEQDSYQGGK